MTVPRRGYCEGGCEEFVRKTARVGTVRRERSGGQRGEKGPRCKNANSHKKNQNKTSLEKLKVCGAGGLCVRNGRKGHY